MATTNPRSSDARDPSTTTEVETEEHGQQQEDKSRDTNPISKEQDGEDKKEEVEDESLLLTRTRSLDIGPAESLAVPQLHPTASSSKNLPPPPHSPDPTTPGAAQDASASSGGEERHEWPHSVRYLILLCSFLTSLSFGVTQVPLLYVFRLMTCDTYYKEHPELGGGEALDGMVRLMGAGSAGGSRSLGSEFWGALTRLIEDPAMGMGMGLGTGTVMAAEGTHQALSGDRCSVHAIESSTALSIGLLGASTTVFGIANLFIAGALIKRIGVKATLLVNISFPAVRLMIQAIGVEVWGRLGIVIIQFSQVITVLGGPSGYLLVLNTFVTEVVEYEGRTAALGRLAGAMMFGSASGFLVGGVVSDVFGVKSPFQLAFVLFVASTLYVAVFLPKVRVVEGRGAGRGGSGLGKRKKSALRKFIEPLVVFAPKKFVTGDGVVQTEYGCLLLACGVFLSILATGYLQTLLQLFSTDVFGFGTTQNGWLIFMYSMLRGMFLTFIFPKLIAVGRRVVKRREALLASKDGSASEPSEREPLLSNQTSATSKAPVLDGKDKSPAQGKDETFKFDLIYTRFSIGADGILTLFCSFVQEGWQMYLVAAILPFSAGTGSAAKGTVLQMIGSSASLSQRADALAGISLVENMSRLSTTFIFGVIFAEFAGIGRTELVFMVNASVALLGLVILLFARFPPDGSTPLVEGDGETAES